MNTTAQNSVNTTISHYSYAQTHPPFCDRSSLLSPQNPMHTHHTIHGESNHHIPYTYQPTNLPHMHSGTDTHTMHNTHPVLDSPSPTPPHPDSQFSDVRRNSSNFHLLNVGAVNIKGIQFTPLFARIVDTLDVFCISGHWLHSYGLFALIKVHPEFHV